MSLEIIYLIQMYKGDLSLNSQQWLMCHKSKSNQMTNVKLGLLFSNTWNHLTVCKKKFRLIQKCYQQNVFKSYIYNIYL